MNWPRLFSGVSNESKIGASSARSEGVAHSDHELEDHIEGERAGPRMRLHDLAGGPGGHLAVRELCDALAVGLDRLTVERGQRDPASRQVLFRLEQHQRAVAEQDPQDLVAVAQAQRVAREQALDRPPIPSDHRPRIAGQAKRPGVAIALASGGEEARLIEGVPDRLHEARQARARRQLLPCPAHARTISPRREPGNIVADDTRRG